MALQIGQTAPDFTLPSTSGKGFTLSQTFQGMACILYFYPKDFTQGCTSQACGFRDNMDEFRSLDIPVVGISRDNMETHLGFKEKLQLPFELLSDEDGKVCQAYDALVPLLKIPKRVTYLLDQHHIIRAALQDMFDAGKHVTSMIAALRQNPWKG